MIILNITLVKSYKNVIICKKSLDNFLNLYYSYVTMIMSNDMKERGHCDKFGVPGEV